MNHSTKATLLNVLKETAIDLWPEGGLQSPGSFDVLYGAADNVSSDYFSRWYHARLALQKSRGSSLYEEAAKTYRVNRNRLFEYKIIPEHPLGIRGQSAPTAVLPKRHERDDLRGASGFFFARELVDALKLHDTAPTSQRVDLGKPTRRGDFGRGVTCPAPDDRALVYPALPALDIAYSAYKRHRDPTKDLPLRGLDSYTPEQIFFLTFCHATCRIDALTGAQYSPDLHCGCEKF
ncbi:hypothetical protein MTO96_033535 [Rhipicephalus appendiculatus]